METHIFHCPFFADGPGHSTQTRGFLCCHTLAVGNNAVVPSFSFIFPQGRNMVTKTTGSQNLIGSVSCECISNAEQLSGYIHQWNMTIAVLPFSFPFYFFCLTFQVFLRNWSTSKPGPEVISGNSYADQRGLEKARNLIMGITVA